MRVMVGISGESGFGILFGDLRYEAQNRRV